MHASPFAAPLNADAADAERRFGGLIRLYGAGGARRIAQAHAVVIGVGGVGSWAAEALARCGVGRLTLIDLDHIAESNINRQVQALDGTLGMSKVVALQERFAQINPDCRIACVEDFVDAHNAAALIPTDAQVVIDCCDQVSAKTAIAALCLQRRQPLFMAGAAGGKRHADALQCADLSEVTHDPLLANVRYQLRRQHGAPRDGRIGVLCAFSREAIVRSQGNAGPPQVSLSTSRLASRSDSAPSRLPQGSLEPRASSPSVGGSASRPWGRSQAEACASSDETSPQSDNSLNCAGFGSSVMVTASMGMILVARALDAVL
ncbi:tRNA threonylcarbamoyladenosine dehydratase [Thiomonas sp.]